jgi:hypothetical protein
VTAARAMAGISSSSAHAAPLSPPLVPPAVEGHGGVSANNDNELSPIIDLLERFPVLFKQKVLQHLDPIDRTFLAQAGGACRAAVAASGLPCGGTRRVVQGTSALVVTHRLVQFCTSVERLAWAKASGFQWTGRTYRIVARVGCLDVLRWAREQGCSWDVWTCVGAAEGGHPEVLKWLHEHGCPWDSNTCSTAARDGHLEVLKWAREHHCPWTEMTCYWAATHGHLEVLQWLRAHGCPWSKRNCEVASGLRPETQAWVQAQP